MAAAVAVAVAVVAPAATVTDAGTVSAVLLLESDTTAPPAGAAPDNVTVHVEVALPLKLVGAQASELITTDAGAASEIEAVCEVLLYVAVAIAV